MKMNSKFCLAKSSKVDSFTKSMPHSHITQGVVIKTITLLKGPNHAFKSCYWAVSEARACSVSFLL